jgi:anionic cell wall polymer biosynthesis LytR-Cps2A-Psr (LCP) family protein
VLLNFNNFIELVDELGGIEVDVPEYAYDYAYSDCNACYEYEVEFLPGPEHMDGERALAYARIRKSDNDFKRIERQQVVIQSTAQRAADLGVLVGSNPIDLYKKYKDSVKTDISDSKIPGLALLGQQIGPTNIRMVSMAEATYSCIDVCGGAAGLLWNLDKVEELKARVFNDGRVQATLDSEAATVEVLNGTETRDLAAEFASFLKRQGIPSTQILIDEQAGGELSERTLIFDRSGKSYTVEKLAEWLNLPATRIRTIPDSDIQRFLDVALGSDVIVVLGDDVNLPSEESANTSFEQTETAGG